MKIKVELEKGVDIENMIVQRRTALDLIHLNKREIEKEKNYAFK
jgi:hypothetical protein